MLVGVVDLGVVVAAWEIVLRFAELGWYVEMNLEITRIASFCGC